MLLNISPSSKLSSAFCTDGSFRRGVGVTAGGVEVAGAGTGTATGLASSLDLFKMFKMRF